MTVDTEIDEGIATESPAAHTAHQGETSRLREQVHRHRREGEEERVRRLEEVVRGIRP